MNETTATNLKVDVTIGQPETIQSQDAEHNNNLLKAQSQCLNKVFASQKNIGKNSDYSKIG